MQRIKVRCHDDGLTTDRAQPVPKGPREVMVQPGSQKLECPKHRKSGRESYRPTAGAEAPGQEPVWHILGRNKARAWRLRSRGQQEPDRGGLSRQLGVWFVPSEIGVAWANRRF